MYFFFAKTGAGEPVSEPERPEPHDFAGAGDGAIFIFSSGAGTL